MIDKIEASAWFARGYRDYYEVKLDPKLTHMKTFSFGIGEQALEKRDCYFKGVDKAQEDYWFDKGFSLTNGVFEYD